MSFTEICPPCSQVAGQVVEHGSRCPLSLPEIPEPLPTRLQSVFDTIQACTPFISEDDDDYWPHFVAELERRGWVYYGDLRPKARRIDPEPIKWRMHV